LHIFVNGVSQKLWVRNFTQGAKHMLFLHRQNRNSMLQIFMYSTPYELKLFSVHYTIYVDFY